MPRVIHFSATCSLVRGELAGIYVGEGLLPIPAKVVEKIMRWDFVEMAKLLPEFWTSTVCKDPTSPSTLRPGMLQQKWAVTDITTWVQCFATYTSVMSGPHPQAMPEFLANLIFILRASQDFGGVTWVTYDSAFLRQAFITGNWHWSKVNPIIAICFVWCHPHGDSLRALSQPVPPGSRMHFSGRPRPCCGVTS